MGFFDQASAGSPGSGIYGSIAPSRPSIDEILNLRARVGEQDANAYKDKTRFDRMMSMQQPRIGQIFGPGGNDQSSQQPMNVVMGPPPLTEFQKQDLANDKTKIGLEGQRVGLEGQRVKQASQFGEERIGVMNEKNALDRQKSDQIYETKNKDLERKANEAQQRADLAQQALTQRGATAQATADYHKAALDAANARHELDMHQKDAQLEELKRQHNMSNENTQNANDLKARPDVTTTEINASGDKKTVTKAKGGRVNVTGPNGQAGTVDAGETLPKGWSLVK